MDNNPDHSRLRQICHAGAAENDIIVSISMVRVFAIDLNGDVLRIQVSEKQKFLGNPAPKSQTAPAWVLAVWVLARSANESCQAPSPFGLGAKG